MYIFHPFVIRREDILCPCLGVFCHLGIIDIYQKKTSKIFFRFHAPGGLSYLFVVTHADHPDALI